MPTLTSSTGAPPSLLSALAPIGAPPALPIGEGAIPGFAALIAGLSLDPATPAAPALPVAPTLPGSDLPVARPDLAATPELPNPVEAPVELNIDALVKGREWQPDAPAMPPPAVKTDPLPGKLVPPPVQATLITLPTPPTIEPGAPPSQTVAPLVRNAVAAATAEQAAEEPQPASDEPLTVAAPPATAPSLAEPLPTAEPAALPGAAVATPILQPSAASAPLPPVPPPATASPLPARAGIRPAELRERSRPPSPSADPLPPVAPGPMLAAQPTAFKPAVQVDDEPGSRPGARGTALPPAQPAAAAAAVSQQPAAEPRVAPELARQLAQLIPAAARVVVDAPAPAPAPAAEGLSVPPPAPIAQPVAGPTPPPAALGQPAPIDLGRAEWMQAMIDRIAELPPADGRREAQIRLVPDALGTIDVTLVEQDERIRVTVTADTPQARQLLSDAAPRLHELAEARGLRFAQADIGGGAAQDRRSNPDQQQQQAPGRPRQARDEPADPSNPDGELIA